MSNIAAIDQNNRGTWTAYNETTGKIERVYCDPITNALLVFVVTDDANIPTVLNNAKIDSNNRATILGYNETTEKTEALRCGNGGELLIISQ